MVGPEPPLEPRLSRTLLGYTEQEALQWIRRALVDCGPRMNEVEYIRWVKQQRAVGEHPPSTGWLRRFGGLARLRERAGGAPPWKGLSRQETLDLLRQHDGRSLPWRVYKAARTHFGSLAEARHVAGVRGPQANSK